MNVSLFGGAITSVVPHGYADVSLLRQVPDNQEVFAHAESDSSVIFDLLQLEKGVPSSDGSPAKFHWHVLARDASAAEANLIASQDLPLDVCPAVAREEPGGHISVAHGLQHIAKFKDTDAKANVVRVCVACIRLPRADTDVLIVSNEPTVLHPDSSSSKLGSSTGSNDQGANGARFPAVDNALSSFVVNDWTLFG